MKRFHFLCAAILLAAIFPCVAFAQAAPQGRTEGFSILQLILLGLVVFWLVRMIRRGGSGRRGPWQGNDISGAPRKKPDRYTQAQAMWEALGGEPAGEAETRQDTIEVVPGLPDGFDVADFVHGAEAAFSRILEAEEGDEVLDYIAEPQALLNLRASIGKEPRHVKRVQARLLGVETIDGRMTATVWFEALFRGGGGRFQQTWEFSREAADGKSSWKFSAVGTATA